MKRKGFRQLKLQDMPLISSNMKYFDGDIYFADNITSPPVFEKVFHINFIVLVFCLEGGISITVNNRDLVMTKHDALFVNTDSFVQIKETTPDLLCKICAIKAEVSFAIINKSLVDTIVQLLEAPVVRLNTEEIELLTKYYELADFKIQHPQFAAKETVASILRSCAIDLLSCIDRHTPHTGNILSQGDKLYRRFLFLVTSNVDGHRSIKSYADQLCVSPKYLTAVCRKYGNRSASDIVNTCLVARINNLLLYSDMSVKEISTQLNFKDLSFFGKFVKKHLGHSPINYRKHNNYGV